MEKAKMKAWSSSDYMMGRLLDSIKSGDAEGVANALSYTNAEMESCGYVLVGEATIEVSILPVEDLQHQQLATLQAELQRERAESMERQNAILDRISKLQALTFEPA